MGSKPKHIEHIPNKRLVRRSCLQPRNPGGWTLPYKPEYLGPIQRAFNNARRAAYLVVLSRRGSVDPEFGMVWNSMMEPRSVHPFRAKIRF